VSAAAPAAIHASAVAWAGSGILVLGAPGSGKSTLVAQLLAMGAYLVADDLVRLVNRAGVLVASGSGSGVVGLIELRGNGIFRVATTNEVPVSLCVELTSAPERDRLPERTAVRLAGVEIALLQAGSASRLAAGQILLALGARRAG
jgi:HPr kinase/phosphorylase